VSVVSLDRYLISVSEIDSHDETLAKSARHSVNQCCEHHTKTRQNPFNLHSPRIGNIIVVNGVMKSLMRKFRRYNGGEEIEGSFVAAAGLARNKTEILSTMRARIYWLIPFFTIWFFL
jgi:hypothetical protein